MPGNYDDLNRERKRRLADAKGYTGPCKHKESIVQDGNLMRCKCGKVVGFFRLPKESSHDGK